MLLRRTRIKKYVLRFTVFVFVILLVTLFAKSINDSSKSSSNLESRSLKLTAEQSGFEKIIREYELKAVPHLGDHGEAAHLEGKDKEEGEKALKSVALNTVLSDRIPLNRTLRDPRHKK